MTAALLIRTAWHLAAIVEGISLAKERGVYRGRRRSLSPEQIEELCRRARSHESVSVLVREYGISRQSVYRYMQAAEARSPQP
jgi:DNA invertase Pin-like site-specific DNA recombinase